VRNWCYLGRNRFNGFVAVRANCSGDKSFGSDSERKFTKGSTNAGAQETAVVLQTHLAAGEKIRDRCDRLFAAPRAGAYRHDEIA